MRLHSSGLRVALLFFLAAMVCVAAHAQTDVALSIYGAFSKKTSDNAAEQVPSNSAGGMIELRHIVNPLVGFEVTYAFNRANQSYFAFCSFCSPAPVSASANAHEIAGDWVFSSHARKLRPFALVGIGILYFQPVGSIQFAPSIRLPTRSSTTAVYVYGVGLDWQLWTRLGLRFQYRGNVHRSPVLAEDLGTPNALTHTAEPAIGVYYKF